MHFSAASRFVYPVISPAQSWRDFLPTATAIATCPLQLVSIAVKVFVVLKLY